MSSTKISKTATIVISGSTFELKNIGPLTTTYSAPAACFTEQYTTTRGVGTWLALGVESRWDCYPPGFSTVDTAWAAYYSPGVCPASYTPAATLPWRWLAPSESGYNCCPIGFTLKEEPTYQLIRSCTRYPTVTVSRTYNRSGTIVSTIYTSVDAPAIAVLWRSGDFSTTTSTTTCPPPTGSPPPPACPTNHTLITVAAVVPVVLIALFTLAFILYHRRATQAIPSTPEMANDNPIELYTQPSLVPQLHPRTVTTATPHMLSVRPPVVADTAPEEYEDTMSLQRKRERVNEHLRRLHAEDRELEQMIISGGGVRGGE